MIGDKAYHGKGYGTEIVSSSIEYMFNILDMNKATLDVLADNIPAVRIYEKNGMYEESISRESVFMNDKFYDVKTMSIINKNNIHP
jgi:RimJ/RimL family protein N-acetyltransferase